MTAPEPPGGALRTFGDAAQAFEVPPPTSSRLALAQLVLGAAAVFASSWFLVFQTGTAPGAGCGGPSVTAGDYVACTSAAAADRALRLLLGPAVLAALVIAGWFVAPAVLARWRRVRPIPDGPVHEALDALAREADLSRAPAWCSSPGSDAWTFGRRPSYRVVLTGAMVRQIRRGGTAPVRAVVLHELSHIRNRDVDQTYATLCGIVAFVVCVAVPLGVDAAATGWSLGFSLGWRLVALVALVVLTGAAVLRSRERDADLRAAVTDRAAMVAAIRASVRGVARRRWSPLRLHPDDPDRLAAVEQPLRSMAASWPEFVAAGIAAGVVLVELPNLVENLLGVGPFVAYVLVGWLTALPLVRVVGLGAWRAAVACAAAGTRPHLVVPGIGLGVGLVLGSQLAPRASAAWQAVFGSAGDSEFSPAIGDVAPSSALWLVGVAVLVGVLWTAWSAAVGVGVRRPGRTVVNLLLVVEAAVVALPLGGWFLALRLAASSGVPAGGLTAVLAGAHAVVALAVVVLGAAALVGVPRRRRPVGQQLLGVLGAVSLVAAVAVPAAFGPPPAEALSGVATPPPTVPFPTGHQVGTACLWLATFGSVGNGADPDYQRRLAAYLVRVDDPVVQRLGTQLQDTAGDPAGPAAETARIALLRRCDVVRATGH